MSRKQFHTHNEPFICLKCGAHNPPAATSERNHCRACLFSVHVDKETPGDRESSCHGLMEPIKIDYRGSKGFMILHRCIQCRKEIWNRAAEDDDIVTLQSRMQ